MTTPLYNKSHPFIASVKDRYSLSAEGSEKSTFHVVLDIKGSGMTYTVGDSVAIFPKNEPELIQRVLHAIQASGKEIVSDKHNENTFSLWEFLELKADLADVSRKLLTFVANAQTNPDKATFLQGLLIEGQRDAFKAYQASREVWDFLEENTEVAITPQELVQLVQPLLPRFYSIASSQAVVGDEIHLTVAELVYQTNGHTRKGICTHYLCRMAPIGSAEIPIYIQPSNGFTIPEDPEAYLIMIGPGTGVAPFRAFMQERFKRKDTGFNWLFFGERHRHQTFFYESDWNEWLKTKQFQIDTAFSRDQAHKVYVQHLVLEKGKEIEEALSRGAYLYVCGDAKEMAKDVDAAIHEIAKTYGNRTEEEAKEFVKRLKKEKKYLRDVY